MLTQSSEYAAMLSYLRSLNFHFLDTWVIECVNYYKSANPDITFDVLKNEVKQQWLLVNLREIKVPSLPPDLKSKGKIVLNGTYAVQVESMLDSSQPSFTQLQKLLRLDTENLEVSEELKEWNVKSNRCLTFVLSDGVQEIQAMEYQPIKKIRTNDPELLPGFKMLIVGPVECRKGMILLKDENVKVCGGEVDTLSVSNSLKNILIRKLQLDENDYSDISPGVGNTNVLSEIEQSTVEDLLSQNDEVFLNVQLEPEIPAVDDLDNQLFNQDISYWSEDALTLENKTNVNKKHALSSDDIHTPNQKRPSLDPAVETTPLAVQNVEDEKDIFIELEEFHPPSSTKPRKPVQSKLFSFFKSRDITSDQVFPSPLHNQIPSCVSEEPFVYLKHITSTKLSKSKIFKIKAVVLTLKNKITIKDNLFNLRATITDGSSTLDVDFCSEILEEFLGFGPSEMAVVMKSRQTNTSIAQKIKDSFSKAQNKLISLNSLMKVRFFTDNKTPEVLSVEEINIKHVKAVESRSKV